MTTRSRLALRSLAVAALLASLAAPACNRSEPKPASEAPAASPAPAAQPAAEAPAEPTPPTDGAQADPASPPAGEPTAPATDAAAPAAPARAPQVDEAQCKQACDNALTITVRELPPDAKPEMRAEVERVLRDDCPKRCLEVGTKDSVECIARARSAFDLVACPK